MKKLLMLFILIPISAEQVLSQEISLDDVKNYIGKQDSVRVCGKIFNARYLEFAEKSPTLFNIGGFFPNQKLTAVIFGEDRNNFPPHPETYFSNSNVCIKGIIIDYNGKPEIVIRTLEQIEVQGAKSELPSEPKVEIETSANDGAILTPTNVNLRSGPSLDFPVISTVPAGSRVTILVSKNGWSKFEVQIKTRETSKTLIGYLKNTALEK